MPDESDFKTDKNRNRRHSEPLILLFRLCVGAQDNRVLSSEPTLPEVEKVLQLAARLGTRFGGN